MSSITISNGPFTGTHVPEDQLRPVLDYSGGRVQDRHGQDRIFWPAHSRTPLFLEKFSPVDGYAVIVESSEAPYLLTDKYYDAAGNPVQQPSRIFTAKLSKDGAPLATAQILQPIFGPWAMTLGEQIARGALYDALGLSLPSYIDPVDGTRQTVPSVPPVVAPAATIKAPVSKLPVPEASAPTPVAAESSPLGDVSPNVSPEPQGAFQAPSPQIAPVATTPHYPSSTAAPNAHIEKNLMSTIETQAAGKGIEVPVFADVQAAKHFLRDLLKGTLKASPDTDVAA